METVLQTEKLSVGIGRTLIHDINVRAFKGEFVLLSGINGSGKSTLLKTIAGIVSPVSGNINICGHPVKRAGQAGLSRLLAFSGTGRISEDYVSIHEMVNFGLYPFAEDRHSESGKAFADACMQKMDVYHLRHKFLSNVSDGEWQKANIARVLAQQTPLIIMDEPSVFLDYPSRNRLFADLKAICGNEGKTIILSSHDMDIAAKYGSKFWHIEGNILHESTEAPVWEL